MELRDFVSRLQKVKRLGEDKYVACCPAHDDGSPSLAITATPTGKILLHCWAGCGAADVVQAMGLKLSDLFPTPLDFERPMAFAIAERNREASRRKKIDYERLIIALAEANRRAGKPMSDADKAREIRAARYLIQEGVEYAADIVYEAYMAEAQQWAKK